MSGNGDRTVSWGALVLPTTTSDRELPQPTRQLSSDPGDSRHWDPSWAALGRWSVLKDLEKAEDLILTVSLDLETRQLTRERGTDQSCVGDFPVANNTAACSRLKVQWPESCTACHSQKLQPLPRNVSACPNSPEAGYGGTVVRVQHEILLSLFSTVRRSSILSPKHLTVPVMIDGTEGLIFLPLDLSFAPALHPRRLLLSSAGITRWQESVRLIV